MLRDITSSLDETSTESMEQTMKEWQQRKRGTSAYDTSGSSTGNDGNVTLPLSQGEWDEPLGLPLSVVCHGVRILSIILTCYAETAHVRLIEWKFRQIRSTPLKSNTAGKKKNLTLYSNSFAQY